MNSIIICLLFVATCDMILLTMSGRNNNPNIEISGPYYKFSKPYGTFVTLQRDEWFVSRKLSKKELKTASECSKITGSRSLGRIIKFRNRDDYVIDQLYPDKRYKTLKGAVNFLVRNEGKLVFCT